MRVIFGVLDGSYNAFLARLEEYGMRVVAPRHEAAAVHMAEAWARITGEPAVVVGGIGPGAAIMVSGLVTAWAEGSPVIALSGQRRRSMIYADRGGSFENVDLLGLYAPVTKRRAGVRDWQRLPELIRRAYREGGPSLVAAAARLLAPAERPFLHAGRRVSWASAWEEFVSLGDHLAAGLSTSLGARGVVPEDHARYFRPLDRAALEAARSEADVVLVVGGRLGELDGWGRAPSWGEPGWQTVIHVDVESTSIGLNRPVEFGIVGGARATLAALLGEVKALTGPRPSMPGSRAAAS